MRISPSDVVERTPPAPRRSLIVLACPPGDVIYVLDEFGEYKEQTVVEIKKKSILTENEEVLFEDHGWLWRCIKPHKHEEVNTNDR